MEEKKVERKPADGRLSREQEFKIDQRIRIGIIIGAVGILIYLVYCARNRKEIGAAYYIIVGGFIALYWILTDVVALKLKHGFAGRTREQKSAYYKMAAIDLVGVAGLGMFLVSGVGGGSSAAPGQGGITGNLSLVGAVIYLVSFMTAKRLRTEYEKTPEELEREKAEKEGESGNGKLPDTGSLPTAADRSSRRMTASERLAELNRQAGEAEEPEEPAGEETEKAAGPDRDTSEDASEDASSGKDGE